MFDFVFVTVRLLFWCNPEEEEELNFKAADVSPVQYLRVGVATTSVYLDLE